MNTMPVGMRFDQRNIVIIPVIFPDQSGVKIRPALVLSCDIFNHNRRKPDIICCSITSNLNQFPHAVRLEMKDMEAGNIKYESMIKPNVLLTIDKTLIEKSVGKIREEKFEEVILELKRIFGL